jgi:alkylhydroperoxidase family enzyme
MSLRFNYRTENPESFDTMIKFETSAANSDRIKNYMSSLNSGFTNKRQEVRSYFDEKQYVNLIMAINAINNWNRLAISTGMYPDCF